MTRRITTAGLRAAVSVIALLVLVAVALYYLGTVGLRVGDRGVRTASLTIPQSNGLVVGSRVLLRGVAIGRVTSVETSVRGVAVGWNYGDRYRIPVDSLFRVDNLSALGETYLGVIPQRDGGPTFDDRATIDTTKVTVPTTLDELAARVVRMLEQVNVKQLRSIINEVNKGLPSDPTVLSNIASASALLETTILSTRGSLDRLLTDFQPLLVKGAGIAPAMAAAGDPVERFAVGLGKFIGEGGKTAATSRSGTDGFIVATHAPDSLNNESKRLLEHVQVFLDRSSPDLKVIGEALLPPVTSFSATMRTVDLGSLMKTALATVGNGDGLVLRVATP